MVRNMACHPSNRAVVASAGGIDAVASAMRRHADVAGVQEQGCGALANVADGNSANKSTIVRGDGVAAVVAAMRRHIDVAAVQEQGCRALLLFSFDSAANQAAVATAGGVEAVIAAMRRHADTSAVQREGCGALRNLTFNSDEAVSLVDARVGTDSVEAAVSALRRLNRRWKDHPRRAAVAAAGGIDAIVAAMRRHASEAGVQEQGVAVLLNLALNDANVGLMVAAGGRDVVAAAKRAHRSPLADECLLMMQDASAVSSVVIIVSLCVVARGLPPCPVTLSSYHVPCSPVCVYVCARLLLTVTVRLLVRLHRRLAASTLFSPTCGAIPTQLGHNRAAVSRS
jgi:hypothetical protein